MNPKTNDRDDSDYDGKWNDENQLPGDIELLLAEIEKEPIPERLRELAEELQRALAGRHGSKREGN